MLRELRKKINELHMISEEDKVIAGVSGGADSVCLLLVLHELQREMKFTLEAIHVEHGIRGAESLGDAQFVEDLCRQLQVPCHQISVDVPAYCKETGLGVEEAARMLRYEAFAQLAQKKHAKIALAHHQEDNGETILFQMIRGSSLAGLCGMQPIREDENGICYIRPLLFWHREEIEKFLIDHNVKWRVDSTNGDMEYSRNFLRGQIIPRLEEINPQAVEHMNQTAAHLTEIKDYMDAETDRLWAQNVESKDGVSWKADWFEGLHPVMQRQIAYKAITTVASRKKDITSTHVDDVCMLSKGQSGKRISLPYGITGWKEFNQVYLKGGQEKDNHTDFTDTVYEVSGYLLETLWENPQENSKLEISLGDQKGKIICRGIQGEEAEIPRKTYTKWFDYDKIKRGFCIRNRRSGDYFISDSLGHHKKLKEYFIDEKIPLSERDKYWLIANESEVLWLIGGRISETIKVTPQTKRILEITYDGE